MIQEIELKYKLNNLQAYKTLLNILPGKHHRENQINYFFDTPDLKLKAQHIFLRLRQSNRHFIFTCKAKPEDIDKPDSNLSIHHEWEEIIDLHEAQKLLDAQITPTELLSKAWNNESKNAKQTRVSLLKRVTQITKEPLCLVGSFKNTRIHVPYVIAHHELDLELDATDFGNNKTDYELEVELPKTLLPITVQAELTQLFLSLGIETERSTGKAERFFALRTPN